MQNNSQQLYDSYKELAQKAADLQYAAALLEWDQEVYMPPKSATTRGRQLATLASQAHEILTSDSYGRLLQELNAVDGLDDTAKANVRLGLEDFEKNKKLPVAFIEELTHQTSASFNAWIQARKENNYQLYAPHLQRMIALKKQQADLYGYAAHPYDALVDDYEKGATVAMLDKVFEMVKAELPGLLNKIVKAPQVVNEFFHRHYSRQQQWNFSLSVLKQMGYDFEAGRQDYSEHPFTTSFSPKDVRVTTRVDEGNFASMLWSSIHEGGHALYEQGLPDEQYGLPLASAASLAIHESQSRLWENCVGRGQNFWKFFYPKLQNSFTDQLADISLDNFYKGMNRVAPSLIRTEADEVTYHFHVLIRYEIEKALLDGSLTAPELAQAWNYQYEKYLGIRPKDDKTGVLQDVHWSHGSFGYFPTYSLGSFYAAQFFQQAHKDIEELDKKIAGGQFADLLQWLRGHIHQYGRRYQSEELCRRVTGRGLDFSAFMRYAENKYADVYGLK